MKLSDWLKLHGKTDAWLAQQVGRERSFVNKIKNGSALPSIQVAARIQSLTGGKVTAADYVPPSCTGARVLDGAA